MALATAAWRSCAKSHGITVVSAIVIVTTAVKTKRACQRLFRPPKISFDIMTHNHPSLTQSLEKPEERDGN